MRVFTLNSPEQDSHSKAEEMEPCSYEPHRALLLTLEDLQPGGCHFLRLLSCCDGGAFCRRKYNGDQQLHEWSTVVLSSAVI